LLNPSDYTGAVLTTPQQIRDLVNCSPASITPRAAYTEWVVDVLHNDFTDWLLDDGTNNATPYFIASGSSIQWNSTQDVQRTCTVSFNGALATQLNTLTALMRISRVYYDHTGNEVLRVPRGLFRFDVPDRDIVNDTGDTIMKVTGFDLSRDLTRIFSIHPLVVPQGLNVGLVIHALLRQDNRTVDEGGRAASGIAVAGGSQGGLPSLTGPVSGTYSASGVDVTTYSVDSATGYLKSPDGPYGYVFYNPFGGARADATSHAPIDPWTGMPMLPLPSLTTHPGGATVIWLSSKTGIAYKSQEGVFYRMNGALLDISYQWDVFKQAPVPAGIVYKQPDILHPPSGTIGTVVPPLASFPNDYDGSGGIGGTGGYFTSTPTVPATPITVGDPQGVFSIYAATLAQRVATITEIVIPTGVYNVAEGLTEPDPHNPSITQIVPQVYPGTLPVYIESPNYAAGTVFPASGWNVSMTAGGFGIKQGAIGIGNCEVYWKDLTGGYNHVGTLAAGDMQYFTNGAQQQNLTMTAFGSLPSFTIGSSGGTVAFKLSIVVFDLVADFINQSIASVTILGLTTGTPGYAGTTTPTSSGSTIPWPQTTFPALAPSGCPCFGANLDESLIDLPTTDAVTGTTYTWDKQTSLNAFINQLCALANWYPLTRDHAGVAKTKERPYYASDGLPEIEWTFSNENPPTDGLLNAPVTQRLGDQTGMWNVIEVEAQQNADGEGIVSIQSNNDPSSIISFPNLGRRVIKIVDASELTTQEEVDTRAFLELQLAATGANALEIQVPLNPFFSGDNDVINVRVVTNDGTVMIAGDSNPFLVTAWTEPADSALMRVICGNTISLDGGVVTTMDEGIGEPIGSPVG
jgi:hypothetical protein